jgi:hypothetical protein
LLPIPQVTIGNSLVEVSSALLRGLGEFALEELSHFGEIFGSPKVLIAICPWHFDSICVETGSCLGDGEGSTLVVRPTQASDVILPVGLLL